MTSKDATSRERARKVVVTGGPGSGKTTLVDALHARGHARVPEAAILVIDSLNATLGVEEQKRWRRANVLEFQTLVSWKQCELEAAAPAQGLVFLDRGLPDGLAYCRHYDAPIPTLLKQLTTAVDYDAVLLLDTLASFESRADSGRTSDRTASLAIRAQLEATYREAGLEPLVLPELGVEQRVQRALELLGED